MKGKCSEPNCPNVVYRRGLCRRHWEAIREAERRAYEEAQRQKEEDNQRVLREMERKSAWREHLPPVVHTEQDELDARALYYSNREREIFRRGMALRC